MSEGYHSELVYGCDYEAGEDLRVRLRIKSMTNHELRVLLLALWRSMEQDDREDFIRELEHYLDRPDTDLPGLAQILVAEIRKASTISNATTPPPPGRAAA